MRTKRSRSNVSRAACLVAVAGAASAASILPAGAAVAAPAASPSPGQAVIDATTSPAYGTTLQLGNAGPVTGAPIYAITSDVRHRFGCTTDVVTTFLGPITCTGPESDLANGVASDEWPAVTTVGRPLAGRGVRQELLGTVYRAGIGNQVTYGGHPLYLFDPPSSPFVPAGEGFLETTLPAPPWQGLWDLVSARSGALDPGRATVETETLPDGSTAVAAQEYPNIGIPGGVAFTAYALRGGDDRSEAARGCRGCYPRWIPYTTTAPPQVTGSAAASKVGERPIGDGLWQVTYGGRGLYLYSQEQVLLVNGQPQTTGSVGNGAGLPGPDDTTFGVLRP